MTMQNGIYRLKYETTTLSATGVVTLRDGSLTGCDRYYFMIGRYQRQRNQLTGKVEFQRRIERPGSREAGIPDVFHIAFKGLASDKFGQFDLTSPDVPLIKGRAAFAWLSGVE